MDKDIEEYRPSILSSVELANGCLIMRKSTFMTSKDIVLPINKIDSVTQEKSTYHIFLFSGVVSILLYFILYAMKRNILAFLVVGIIFLILWLLIKKDVIVVFTSRQTLTFAGDDKIFENIRKEIEKN